MLAFIGCFGSMGSMSREAQLYEIGLLIKPELAEQEAAEVLGTVRSYVEQQNGVVESTTDPKVRELGYPVKKAAQAYFAALQFVLDPAAVSEVKKNVDANGQVLRHMVLSWKKEAPRPVMRYAKPEPTRPAASPLREEERTDEKIDIQEIDKKLEEILGEETPQP